MRITVVLVWVTCNICKGKGGWVVNGKMVVCLQCQSTGEVRRTT